MSLKELILWVYSEAYKKAKPRLDFKRFYRELLASGRSTKPNWFMKFYLPEEELDRIVKTAMRKRKLNRLEEQSLKMEAYLGGTPNSSMETWLKEWGGKAPRIREFKNYEELMA